jgi:dihydrofolate reductase
MSKLVLFMHLSLDGFTARSGGEMDWIRIDEEMFKLAQSRTEHAETALYGRKTYEIMNAYWPTAAGKPGADWHDIQHGTWYNQVRKVVVSKSMNDGSAKEPKIISRDIFQSITDLKKQTNGEIIMFGSPSLAGSLMQENLIDDYWLLVNPIILGQGISLFSINRKQIQLQLVETTVLRSGVVCLHYSKI